MAWPPKISLFGEGSGRMSPPPADVFKRYGDEMRRERKRAFMQEAALVLMSEHKLPSTIAAIAEDIYEAIEEKVNKT